MDKNSNIEKIIRKTYFDLKSPAAYLTVDKMLKQAKKTTIKLIEAM